MCVVAQELMVGTTNYKIQTSGQILDDINKWIQCSNDTAKTIRSLLEQFQNPVYFDRVIPDVIRDDINIVLFYTKTVNEDLSIVKKAVESDCVTSREIKLLYRIAEQSSKLNYTLGTDYNCESYWKNYGDSDFMIVENIYGEARDYVALLEDANNAASRLEDYMQTGNIMNSTINNTINGNVTGSQIQVGTVNSSQNMTNGITDFPYEEVLNKLMEICKYKELVRNDLGTNADSFNDSLDEVVEETKKKGSPEIIKKGISVMKDILTRAASGVLVDGIKSIISQLPL